jgi:hypothetical protein
MYLCIHIDRKLREFFALFVDFVFDFGKGFVYLKDVAWTEAATKIPCRSGVENLFTPNYHFYRIILSKSLQVIQRISSRKGIGRNGQNVFRLGIPSFFSLYLDMVIQNLCYLTCSMM